MWIVEMKMEETGEGWEPTVECGLTRDDAKNEKRRFKKKDNPGDKFRVRKYVRKEGK